MARRPAGRREGRRRQLARGRLAKGAREKGEERPADMQQTHLPSAANDLQNTRWHERAALTVRAFMPSAAAGVAPMQSIGHDTPRRARWTDNLRGRQHALRVARSPTRADPVDPPLDANGAKCLVFAF